MWLTITIRRGAAFALYIQQSRRNGSQIEGFNKVSNSYDIGVRSVENCAPKVAYIVCGYLS